MSLLQKEIPERRDMGQGLNTGINAVGLVQIVKSHKARQIASSEQISRQFLVLIHFGDFVFGKGRVQGSGNIGERSVLDLVIVGQAVEFGTGQVHKDKVAVLDAVRVRGRLRSATPKELATHETAVNVRTRLEGDAAGWFKVKVEHGSLDGVQVGTGTGRRFVF